MTPKNRLILGSLVLSLIPFSASAAIKLSDDVSLSGSLEADLFVRTNQKVGGNVESDSTEPRNNTGVTAGQEIDAIVNLDGKHDTLIGYLVWRVAQKVATDYKFDGIGNREAWVGLDNSMLGTVKFGKQFSNMYLLLDTYSGKGAHWVEDYGVGTTWYGQSLSYTSPSFGGVSFSAQGLAQSLSSDVATTTNAAGKTLSKSLNTQAYEAMLTYDSDVADGVHLNANVGYYDAQNTKSSIGSIDDTTAALNNDKLNNINRESQVLGGGNKSTAIFGAVKVNIEQFNVVASAKQSQWKGIYDNLDTRINTGEETFSNLMLHLGVGYDLDFGIVSLGGGMITNTNKLKVADENGDKKDAKDGMTMVNFQYDHFLDAKKNAVAFLQIRHHMLGSDGNVLGRGIDGMSNVDKDGKAVKNVSRVLVGVWYGF